MRLSNLALAGVFALGLAAPAFAQDAPEAQAPVADQTAAPAAPAAVAPEEAPAEATAAATATADDETAVAPAAAEAPQAATSQQTPAAQTSDAPAADASDAPAADAEATGDATAAATAPTAEPEAMPLGPVGYDASGRAGRIHVVRKGDTLWDISDAYLGTPWVWPSIWKDNEDIENPHLIYPGDKIWVSPHEMRRVTDEEAAKLLAGTPAGDYPAAIGDAVPYEGPRPTYHFSEIEDTGFVGMHELEGAAAIVDSPSPRVWLTDHTPVMIGLGKGDVNVGDQFEIFRTSKSVKNLDGIVVGYSTLELGWLEVTEVHDESSTAMIRMSRMEIQRGDHIMPRRKLNPDIEVGTRPDTEGRVIFAPKGRTEMGGNDIVYLNKGSKDGLAVGSPLEIYRPMGTGVDDANGRTVALPDQVVAKLLVVDARDESAVAVITHASTEVGRGDFFRGSDDIAP